MTDNGNLRIKRHFSLVPHSPDDVELRSGVWNPISFALRDDSKSGHLFDLVSRLDGTASPAQIAKERRVPREEVEALIDHLLGLEVLESGPSKSLDYFLDNLVPSRRNGDAPSIRPVVILGDDVITEEICRTLALSLPAAQPRVLSADLPAAADAGRPIRLLAHRRPALPLRSSRPSRACAAASSSRRPG